VVAVLYLAAVSRWRGYWFGEGGRSSAAIVRVAIAIAVLSSLARLATLPTLVAPVPLYRPVGIWMVLGRTPPPAGLVDLLWICAWVGTLAMLVGWRTRTATAISFVAASSLAALSFSGTLTWSHQYNVVLIAQAAFLGARGGDVLSVDALVRRRRGLPPLDIPGGYQWSLRLVQLAVALMFAGAFFHKIASGHGTLRWALSDNLRHHLLVRFDLAGLPRPALVEWIIDDVWRYRSAAVLNLVAQLVPIFACIFVRRPWLRALCGLAFVIETIALGLVIGLWNLQWLPLAAVFVDWDRLLRWLARRPPPAPRDPAPPPRGASVFLAGFLGYTLLTAFVPTLDRRLNTYPFSGFPMFSTIRAAQPYDEHLPYRLAGDHIEPIGNTVHVFAQRWLDHAPRGVHRLGDPAKVRAKLASIVGEAPRRYPDATIRGLRHYLTIFEAPAYPAPAQLVRHPLAITGELHPDGTFRAALGAWRSTPEGSVVEPGAHGLDLTSATLEVYRDNVPVPLEVTAVRRGAQFMLPPITGDVLYAVAVIDGVRWLVATRD